MLCTLALLTLAGPPAGPFSGPSSGQFAATGPARSTRSAPDDVAKKALALRNTTGALWEAGKYGEAAKALREALALYDGALEAGATGYVKERSMTLRALVWNECRGGQMDAALGHFERMVDLRAEAPAIDGEVRSAYGALMEAGGRQKSRKALESHWDAVARIYADRDDAVGLGQVEHDRASHLAGLGDERAARRALARAISIRREAGDVDGLSWSLNNLGYSHLDASDWKVALGHFGEALEVVRNEGATAAQSALGYNVLQLGAHVLEGTRPDRGVVEAMWTLAEAEARSGSPSIVAPERLLALAFEIALARVGAKRSATIAERLASAAPDGPAPVRADLALRAAEALIEGGGAKQASELLAGLEVDGHPVSPHLTVRHLVLRARVAADAGDGTAFETVAPLALEAVDSLGHDGTTRQALEALAEAGAAFPGTDLADDLAARWESARRKGRPGGSGGSFLGGENGPAPEKLSTLEPHAPLFELTSDGNEVVMRDLLSGDVARTPVQWVVRTVSFNGMEVELFGAYASIAALHYGSKRGVKGTRSGLSLDDLDNFRPLDAERPLRVTRNGATSYGG